MSRVRKRPRWMLVFGAVVAATAAAVVVPTLPASGGTKSSKSPAATAAAKGLPLWTNVTSSVVGTPPSPRSEAAIANQPWGGYDLMFGGMSSNGTILGDTWALFDNNWVDLNLPGSPPARAGASMAFLKGFREYMVMFGGLGSNGQVLGDTWQFQGGVWTELHPTISPPPRQLATLIYSPADNEMLLFGGTNATKTVFYNDTWSFRNGQWTQLKPNTSPPARAAAGMVYDGSTTTNGSVILFGGSSAGGDLNDTWQFAGGQWTQLSPTNSPPARDSFGMAYDLERNGVLVFGGFEPSGSCGGEVGDSWLYSDGNWTQLSPASSPPARQGAAMTDELRNNGIIDLFGGVSGTCGANPTYYGDTWQGDQT